MKILLIEDDQDAARYIVKGLKEAGHVVDHAADGKTGLFLAGSEPYDILIVDRMLPGRDGVSLIEVLRGAEIYTPALILSALSGVDDRVTGLRAGADDYMTKPYAFSELLARVEALGRRHAGGQVKTVLKVADLEMDLLSRTVRRGGHVVDLLPREFALLEYLMRNAGAVVTRTMLLEAVWGYHFDPKTNVIEVHIARLRQKIDRDQGRPLIHTVRGAGYSIHE
ncbi:winged helix-turn-helix domain-containing protein [Zavarzinia sp. CC-PAN008]|uniref:winged helix-turn-helix domain-containing protein n=1 Tax=Zavarzinia sp. CC-PAN008 TaxID=3243332 RepID=UPI003F7481B3